jgi:hypothetical protein
MCFDLQGEAGGRCERGRRMGEHCCSKDGRVSEPSLHCPQLRRLCQGFGGQHIIRRIVFPARTTVGSPARPPIQPDGVTGRPFSARKHGTAAAVGVSYPSSDLLMSATVGKASLRQYNTTLNRATYNDAAADPSRSEARRSKESALEVCDSFPALVGPN